MNRWEVDLLIDWLLETWVERLILGWWAGWIRGWEDVWQYNFRSRSDMIKPNSGGVHWRPYVSGHKNLFLSPDVFSSYTHIRLRVTRGETFIFNNVQVPISVFHKGEEITFLIATEFEAATAYKSTCKVVVSKVRHEMIQVKVSLFIRLHRASANFQKVQEPTPNCRRQEGDM